MAFLHKAYQKDHVPRNLLMFKIPIILSHISHRKEAFLSCSIIRHYLAKLSTVIGTWQTLKDICWIAKLVSEHLVRSQSRVIEAFKTQHSCTQRWVSHSLGESPWAYHSTYSLAFMYRPSWAAWGSYPHLSSSNTLRLRFHHSISKAKGNL